MMQLGILAYYSLKTDEIVAKYCVNKNQPDLCCKGKCYISKQLDSPQKDIPNSRGLEEREIPFFLIPEQFKFTQFLLHIKTTTEFTKHSFSKGYLHPDFQPPEVILV